MPEESLDFPGIFAVSGSMRAVHRWNLNYALDRYRLRAYGMVVVKRFVLPDKWKSSLH